MSRREAALEEALKIREAGKGPAPAGGMQETVEELTDLPRFEAGETAIDPARVDKHVVCITEPHSLAAEQYKRIRARIIKGTAKSFLNTIMVTSPDVSEGKSITALNLAITLAKEIDYTVLLVDADLRNPSIHRYLGMEPQYGLSDYLVGRVKLPDVLIKTGIGKLVVLPGGNVPANPSELLSSERMRSLVHEMKLRYKNRYVIFDSSPLLVTADPLSLSGYMDGIILLIQAARTSSRTASQAVSLLKDRTILGVIFNKVPQYLSSTIYPYHYEYGQQGAVKVYRYGQKPKQATAQITTIK